MVTFLLSGNASTKRPPASAWMTATAKSSPIVTTHAAAPVGVRRWKENSVGIPSAMVVPTDIVTPECDREMAQADFNLAQIRRAASILFRASSRLFQWEQRR